LIFIPELRGVKTLAINGRPVGAGSPCFIIAEAGVNHNGQYKLACELIDAAHEAGADAVKFQTWITEELLLPDASLADYQRKNTKAKSQFDMIKELELSHDEFRRLKKHAEKRGVLFLSTPDEEKSADYLDRLNLPLLKIGSGEITNLPFLRHISRKGRPVVLSTGMSTLAEVEIAVRTIEAEGNTGLILLHCVSNYPAEARECNLRAMETLRAAFGYPVGWSDHTLGYHVAIAAVALGACVIEKHLTLDNAMKGPDHRASLDPAAFQQFVLAVREAESSLGNGRKIPSPAEIKNKNVVQKSLVLKRSMRRGEIISEADVAMLRTSSGLPITALSFISGRRLRVDVPARTTLLLDHVC
jgi:N,N'-diacetyllegionaminate synthase